MRLMAGAATFVPHRRVFEREWTPLIAMTTKAARLVGGKASRHGWTNRAMRVMAIDARHRVLRHPVMVGLLKLRDHTDMTSAALFVHRGSRPRHQNGCTRAVNFMTRGAGHLVPGMTALQM